MTTPGRRLAALWALAAALMLPLRWGEVPPVNAFFQAVGMGLFPALAGAAVLHVGRAKPDAGMRQAAITVAVVCALLWFGSITNR